MKLRVCICCGEPINANGSALCRNPNVCASCSSLADGAEECREVAPAWNEPSEALTDQKPAEARHAA